MREKKREKGKRKVKNKLILKEKGREKKRNSLTPTLLLFLREEEEKKGETITVYKVLFDDKKDLVFL